MYHENISELRIEKNEPYTWKIESYLKVANILVHNLASESKTGYIRNKYRNCSGKIRNKYICHICSLLILGAKTMPRQVKNYDPREAAKVPKKQYTWETVTKTSNHFKIPKGKPCNTKVAIETRKVEGPSKPTYAEKAETDRLQRSKRTSRGNKTYTYVMPCYIAIMKNLLADPRRQPQASITSAGDPKRQEDQRYLNWIITDGIPNTARNVQYFEKLADNIRQDIGTSELQLQAVRDMEKQGV